MSVPTHSTTCTTRAFPTKCRYCNEEAYYFFCTCGTKLLFESLGPPWPIHHCLNEVEDLIDLITETYGTVDVAVLNRIRNLSEERGINLSDKIISRINSYLKKNDNKPTRRKIQPTDKETLVVGQIVSINHRINFYKKLNIQNSPIGKQLLNHFGKESFSEMKVRTDPDQNNVIEEYEIIIPESLANRLVLKEKSKVVIKINMQTIAMSKSFWCVEYIDIIY